MKTILAAACAALTLGLSQAHAALVQFTLDGTLGQTGLAVSADFRGASLSGTFTLDTEALVASAGNDRTFAIVGFDVTMTAADGSQTFLFASDGEANDSGTFGLANSADRVVVAIFEDIDDPDTVAVERRLIQLNFNLDPDVIILDFAALIANDPDFGRAANLDLGLLQFSTSQVPSPFATASVAAVGDAVPIPAAATLFVPSLAAGALLRRRLPRRP